jgi:hypothetical protein
MRRCKRCLLPEAVPGSDIDSAGVCRPCREYSPGSAAQEDAGRAAREADLEAAIAQCRGQGQYDVLVPFSGGKDSAWMLYKLVVEYKLKVLAFTVDVNIPPVAWKNIRRTLAKLNIDHITYSPPADLYRKLFAYLLRNQEARGATYTVSYVYAPLFEGDAIKTALEKGIPLVMAGYSPGQPEPERMLYEFSRPLIERTDWTPPELKCCGQFTDDELGRFFNPGRYPAGTRFPRYLAPFHAWRYSQDEAMRGVVEHGLIETSRNASPVFSNYPINWLLMYSDLKNFGYNPYAPEFATLIREGKAKLSEWRIMGPIVDLMVKRCWFLGKHTTEHLKWLGMTPDDLRITLPRGAYDPVIEAAA